MPKFRKKPIVIEAIRYEGNTVEITDWAHKYKAVIQGGFGTLEILTLEGWLTAKTGDWIIKGVADEFYPCKPDIFATTYEPVE